MEYFALVDKPTNPRFVDYEGKRFDRLFVKSYIGKDESGIAYWQCVCDCGRECKRASYYFGNKSMLKSCGCARGHHVLKHGASTGETSKGKIRSYTSWRKMKQRCGNPNHNSYKNYGGRGISVDERWLNSFDNFLKDMGECPQGKSLDRYPDKNGNYTPNNARWATREEQARNTRRTKLDLKTVRALRKMVASGSKISEAHRSLARSADYSTVWRAINGHTWEDVGNDN